MGKGLTLSGAVPHLQGDCCAISTAAVRHRRVANLTVRGRLLRNLHGCGEASEGGEPDGSRENAKHSPRLW